MMHSMTICSISLLFTLSVRGASQQAVYPDEPVENRIKMFRLVEKMAMESADTISDIHGGGSPEAHRVTILRETNLEGKKKAAKRLAGIAED